MLIRNHGTAKTSMALHYNAVNKAAITHSTKTVIGVLNKAADESINKYFDENTILPSVKYNANK
jgi:hypothetical protein